MTETANAAKSLNCPYCGLLHERTVCSLIKAIEYHPSGSIKRVEFKTAADAPRLNDWTVGIGSGPMASDKAD